VDAFTQCHYKDNARQADIAATEAGAAKRRKYDDFFNDCCFQPVAVETTGVYGKSTAFFRAASQRNLLIRLGNPGSNSGFTSACPWVCSEEMLPVLLACAQVWYGLSYSQCTNQCYSLPLAFVPMYSYCLQNVRAFCKFYCPLVQCYFTYWLTILITMLQRCDMFHCA